MFFEILKILAIVGYFLIGGIALIAGISDQDLEKFEAGGIILFSVLMIILGVLAIVL